MGIIKDGLSYIPPGHEWRLILTSLNDPEFNRIIMNEININVTYKNHAGANIYNKYNINLSRFCGFDILNDTENHAKADILTSRACEINQSNEPHYSESDYS